MKKIRIIALMLAALMILAIPAAAAEAETKTNLNVGYTAGFFLGGVDPQALSTMSIPFGELMLIYDPIFYLDSETGEMTSDILEDWYYSDDYLTLTLVVKDGVTFSNGDVMDAQDILYAVQRSAASHTGGSYYAYFDLDKCKVSEDGKSVDLVYTSVFGPGIRELTCVVGDYDFLKEYADDESTDWYDISLAVGSGPYKLTELDPESHATFELRDDYWGDRTFDAQTIDVYVYTDQTTMFIDYENGVLDLALGIGSSDAVRLENGESVGALQLINDNTNALLCLSDENEYFQDARVREAICHAIDINILTEMGAGILGTVAVGSFPAAMPYCVEGLTYDYDPDLSKQLLEEAGIADGEITLKYVTFNDPIKSASADIVKNDLANIGINVEISTLDNMSAVAEWMKEDGTDLQMMTAGGGVFELEPYGIFTFFYKDNVFFATNKDDPEFNEYLDKGLSTVEPVERGEYWASAQQWLYDNFWVIPTYETYSAVAVGDSIESTGLYSALRPDLRFVEFK